jgi:hypothetical protein
MVEWDKEELLFNAVKIYQFYKSYANSPNWELYFCWKPTPPPRSPFPPVSPEPARTQSRKKAISAPKGSKKRSRSASTASPVKTEKYIKAERIKPEPVEEEPEELFFEESEEEELKSVGAALPEDVSELIQEETQSKQGVQTRSQKPKS